jgi:SAM-dependent methyltransferase
MNLAQFVLSNLPPPPARVLEIGCGAGELARALATARYDVTGIDPEAPEEPIFRRVTLADFDEPGPYDAVVASRSLHHLPDLGTALDKVARLLRPGGVLILREFAKERLDETTADWYFRQRRALAAAGGAEAPATLADCRREWEEEHTDIHGFEAMRRELDRRFVERFFAWEPYLYRELEGVASETLERTLVETGAIQATGWLYVGDYAPREGGGPA